MFELDEITRRRGSEVFAEILNRSREGDHNDHNILKITKRIVHDDNSLINIPHLLTQNKKVNDFSERVHQAAIGEKHTIKSQDGVIGATSSEADT